MSRPTSPPYQAVFAISKCKTFNPLLYDVSGVLYTKHYILRGRKDGKDRTFIVDVEIFKEEAVRLIQSHKMTRVVHNEDGTLWETTPTLRSECQRLGLKYSTDLRPY